MADIRWTASLVEARFEEAADTLRRLPPVLAKPMLCSWPTIIRDFWEAYGWEETRVRLGPPSAAAIDRMDEALAWLGWLEADEARIVWLRAEGVRWKVITLRFGIGRTKAWQTWTAALIAIAARLEASGPSRANKFVRTKSSEQNSCEHGDQNLAE